MIGCERRRFVGLERTVAPLNVEIALNAALLSTLLKLPMAESIMLASARAFAADLWTQDADFAGIEGVHYVEHM